MGIETLQGEKLEKFQSEPFQYESIGRKREEKKILTEEEKKEQSRLRAELERAYSNYILQTIQLFESRIPLRDGLIQIARHQNNSVSYWLANLLKIESLGCPIFPIKEKSPDEADFEGMDSEEIEHRKKVIEYAESMKLCLASMITFIGAVETPGLDMRIFKPKPEWDVDDAIDAIILPVKEGQIAYDKEKRGLIIQIKGRRTSDRRDIPDFHEVKKEFFPEECFEPLTSQGIYARFKLPDDDQIREFFREYCPEIPREEYELEEEFGSYSYKINQIKIKKARKKYEAHLKLVQAAERIARNDQAEIRIAWVTVPILAGDIDEETGVPRKFLKDKTKTFTEYFREWISATERRET